MFLSHSIQVLNIEMFEAIPAHLQLDSFWLLSSFFLIHPVDVLQVNCYLVWSLMEIKREETTRMIITLTHMYVEKEVNDKAEQKSKWKLRSGFLCKCVCNVTMCAIVGNSSCESTAQNDGYTLQLSKEKSETERNVHWHTVGWCSHECVCILCRKSTYWMVHKLRGNPQIESNRAVNLDSIVFFVFIHKVFNQVDFSCFHKRLALLIHAKGLITVLAAFNGQLFPISRHSSFCSFFSFFHSHSHHHHHHYLFPFNRWGLCSLSVY